MGDPMLVAHWTDVFKVKRPEATEMQVQDRAYTSPIWYTPGS